MKNTVDLLKEQVKRYRALDFASYVLVEYGEDGLRKPIEEAKWKLMAQIQKALKICRLKEITIKDAGFPWNGETEYTVELEGE